MSNSNYLFCLLALILAGCAGVSPAGLIAASRLDPLESPPGNISVAVSVPDAVQLKKGDADLSLAFVPDDPERAASISKSVPLSISSRVAGPRDPKEGEAIFVLGFSEEDAVGLTAIQDQIKSLRSKGVEGSGSLSVAITGGCVTRELDDGLPVTIWLRTDPGAKFVLLTRSADLFKETSSEDAASFKDEMQRC